MEEGAPLGEGGAPLGEWSSAKCGMMGCHLSHIQKRCQLADFEGPRMRHLSQWWAVHSRMCHLSKRGALLKMHMFKT